MTDWSTDSHLIGFEIKQSLLTSRLARYFAHQFVRPVGGFTPKQQYANYTTSVFPMPSHLRINIARTQNRREKMRNKRF